MFSRMTYRFAIALFFGFFVASWAAGSGAQGSGTIRNRRPTRFSPFAQNILSSGTDVIIYVSPGGSDSTGNGSLQRPYATINRALQDVPTSVSQHYAITLSPGTYYEEVDIGGRTFAGTTIGNFNKAAIEIKGDPASPDSYVISAASAQATTSPLHPYALQCVFANCILNGISLQSAAVTGYHQVSGFSAINSSTFRHFTTPKATGIFIDTSAICEIHGNNTVDDVYFGIQVANAARLFAYDQENGGDPLNTGFPEPHNQTVSGVAAGGKGIQVYDDGQYEVSRTTTVSCVGKPSWGLQVGDSGVYDSETTNVSGCSTSVLGYVFGQIEINVPIFSNANIGVQMIWHSSADWLGGDPTFTDVITPYSLSGESKVSTPTQNLFDGSLTSTGSVAISAGGTNENVNLTPSGNGSIVLNGLVGIGKASTGAKLMISGSGGSQSYVDVVDQEAKKDTLVNLNTTGSSNDSFFVRAQSDGVDKWWVKGDGSAFSTSFATALNVVQYSASPIFDGSLGNSQEIVLTGDVTSSTLVNARPGQDLAFIVCQDAAGGHHFTWPPNFKDGMTIGEVNIFGQSIGAAPLICSTQTFIFDGTIAYATSPGVSGM